MPNPEYLDYKVPGLKKILDDTDVAVAAAFVAVEAEIAEIVDSGVVTESDAIAFAIALG